MFDDIPKTNSKLQEVQQFEQLYSELIYGLDLKKKCIYAG